MKATKPNKERLLSECLAWLLAFKKSTVEISVTGNRMALDDLICSVKAGSEKEEYQPAKPWFIWGRHTLTFWDCLRLLCGWHLYIRFDSPDGNCHAACDLSHKITRADYNQVKWLNGGVPDVTPAGRNVP